MKRIAKTLTILSILLPAYLTDSIRLIDASGMPTIEEKSKNLEPIQPTTLPNPPFQESPKPKDLKPIKEVINKGHKLPYKVVLNLPLWERPSYLPYWHSGVRRWSDVPNRVHYATHRLFVSSTNASALYDFIHDVGIVDEMAEYKNFTVSLNEILVVVMNAEVTRLKIDKQQIVVLGKPKETGLTIFTIRPPTTTECLYFHLSTPQGDPVDSIVY